MGNQRSKTTQDQYMPFITRQWRLKLEDYLVITVSTFSPDLASIDKFTMAYHVQLNTVFVKSSLKKTWTNNFRSAYRKVSGRMNGKPHAGHILISSVLTSLHLFGVLRHIIRPYGLQKLDVIIWMVFSHLVQICFVRALNFKRRRKKYREDVHFNACKLAGKK